MGEKVDGLRMSHAVAVVFYPDLLNAAEAVFDNDDLDVTSLSVDGVPNELGDARDGVALGETVQVVLPDVDRHPGSWPSGLGEHALSIMT